MKILGRIVYALIAGIILLYVLNISESIITAKYFEKYGPTAALQKDDEFFYGGSGFHLKDPTIQINKDGYEIKFYEVNRLFVHNKTNEKKVDEYLYILIYDNNNIINPNSDQEYFLSFYNQTEDSYYDISIRRFRELDVFVAVYLDSNEMSSLLVKEAFLDQSLDEVSLIKESNDGRITLVTDSFHIEEADFVIKDILLNHYDVRENLGVYDKTIHSTQEFQSTYYLATGIYMGLLILTTYFVFFFDFKKLRRKKKIEEIKQDESL